MAYRYYSTLRPLMVGGIPFPKQPGESITTIVNFEEGRTYCKDIDRPAWGYIEYTAPLDPQQVSDYELVLAPEEVKDELEKIGPPKEFKKTPQPKTVGELDAAWRGIEDGRKFDPSNKLEEKKQEA